MFMLDELVFLGCNICFEVVVELYEVYFNCKYVVIKIMFVVFINIKYCLMLGYRVMGVVSSFFC